MDLSRSLAESLRRLRVDEKLTHAQVAKRLGISRPTYTRLENGNQNTTLQTLGRLCRALGCRPGELFEGGATAATSTALTSFGSRGTIASMEPSESGPCASVAAWAAAFPRLFEIYAASDRTSLDNWFQLSNVWRGLAEEADGLKPIEENLQVLDAESWAVFRVKAAKLVHLSDTWGYSRPLFDCLNETKGYRFLIGAGYQDVRFIPEKQGARTPDLRARSGTATIFSEVKTVNESVTQKDYFTIPGEQRMARDVEYHLSTAFKNKLASTIAVARTQLLAAQDQNVIRRIVYLVIRPDTNVETGQDLAAFLQSQNTPGIEVVHHLLE